MALAITFFLGLFFIIGILITKLPTDQELAGQRSISIALGALLALAAFDLVPDVFENIETVSVSSLWLPVILVFTGIGLFKLLDHFIPEHHEANESVSEGNLVHVGIISAIAISLHNIVEGMTVYTIAAADLSTGLALALGIGLHNIPMGMLIYSTTKKEPGFKKYLILSASTISTFVGGILMHLVSSLMSPVFLSRLLCIELGMVLYILIFELFPSVAHLDSRKKSIIYAVLGFLIVLISTFFSH